MAENQFNQKKLWEENVISELPFLSESDDYNSRLFDQVA